MKTLQQEFDNGEAEHFTNYDYIIQLIDNGRYSVLKDFLKEIDNIGLINLVRNRMKAESYFADEILRRLQINNALPSKDEMIKALSNDVDTQEYYINSRHADDYADIKEDYENFILGGD